MRFNPFQKLILTFFLTALVVLLTGTGYFWLVSQIKNLEGSIRSIKSELILLEKERTAVRKINFWLEEKNSDVARIKKFFVERDEIVEFIETLEGLAKNSGNKIALDYDEFKSQGEYLFFRLTADGTEKSVRRYLEAMEFLPYEIRTADIAFQKLTQGRENTSLAASGTKIPEIIITHRLIIGIMVKTSLSL